MNCHLFNSCIKLEVYSMAIHNSMAWWMQKFQSFPRNSTLVLSSFFLHVALCHSARESPSAWLSTSSFCATQPDDSRNKHPASTLITCDNQTWVLHICLLDHSASQWATGSIGCLACLETFKKQKHLTRLHPNTDIYGFIMTIICAW